MSKTLKLTLLIVIALSVTSCGKKGPLVSPQAKNLELQPIVVQVHPQFTI